MERTPSGHDGISRVIQKRVCRNSRGPIKSKWNFQGQPRKNHADFLWVWNFQRGVAIQFYFVEIPGVKFCFVI